MKSNIKKNTILNIIKTCCSVLFPVITYPYITRVLLADNIGKVSFAQSFVNYFSLIASLGISTYAIRECSVVRNNKQKLTDVASQLYSINLITTIISYILLIFTMIIGSTFRNYCTLIIIESLVILMTTIGTDWINSAMEDLTYITVRSVSFQIISLILMFCIVRTPDDYYKYAIISVFSTAGPNIINIFYRRKYCRIRFTTKIEWNRHITSIILLFVMMLSQTIFNNVDITMIGLIKDDTEVGYYTVAYKITRIISQIVQSLSVVIIPRLSYYFSNDDFDGANKLLKKVLSFNIALGLPCAIGTMMLAPEIGYLIGGKEFIIISPTIRILMLSFVFSLVGGSFFGNAILIPMKNEKYYMIVCLITAFINVILNAILIPLFGANGAAMATACNGLFIMLLLLLKVDKRIKIDKILSIFFAPCIGCLLIVAICIICKSIQNLLIKVSLSIGISMVLYGIVLLVMKYELAIESINSLKNKIRRDWND